MAKKSAVEKNKRREAMCKKFLGRRAALNKIVHDRSSSAEERFQAVLKLAALPRNAAPSRIKNRCCVTGRPRSYYRSINVSRIALREFASRGCVPGMTKSSW